jgi:hypothetical protein
MDFAAHNKVGHLDPDFQRRLIRKFGRAADPRHVTVYSTRHEEDGKPYYEGRVEWEVLEDALAYDSSLGRNEVVSVAKSHSRNLGRSAVDWVQWAK